jgi:hypothetical protein
MSKSSTGTALKRWPSRNSGLGQFSNLYLPSWGGFVGIWVTPWFGV